MLRIDVATLKGARMGGVSISLTSLLNVCDAVTAQLKDEVPDWLAIELANEGLCLYKDSSWQWFLEPLSD